VSFGHFLIKQVVEEISRDVPKLSTFVTLSPVPAFAAWLRRERSREASPALTNEDRLALAALDAEDWWIDAKAREALREPLSRAAAWYFLHGRNGRGLPVDPVARFHLGNGARLEQINVFGDLSDNGLKQSYGLMVNYLYDLDYIERNHEAFAQSRTIAASSAVKKLVRGAPAELVPLAG
jgi:malonyl-CoA decarboxylase